MSRTIDFYFDFMSPFAYLAQHRLFEIAAESGSQIAFRPIDLKQAKLAAGNDGPSNQQIPPKLRYMIVDLLRWASEYGIPFNPITGQDSARMNTGTYLAIDRGQADAYVREGFRLGYVEGSDIGDDAVLRALARGMDWDPEELLAYVVSEEARRRYEQENRAAQAAGVFGVPTTRVGEEMWWGNDRLEFMRRFLAGEMKSPAMPGR